MSVLRFSFFVWTLKIVRLKQYDLAQRNIFELSELLETKVLVDGQTTDIACEDFLSNIQVRLREARLFQRLSSF